MNFIFDNHLTKYLLEIEEAWQDQHFLKGYVTAEGKLTFLLR